MGVEIKLKGGYYQDSVHGRVEFENSVLFRLTLTKEFTRLTKISQLGPGIWKKFPTANHTRFAHSIGTYFLCRKAILHLKDNKYIKSLEGIAILAAALLHDIGHGPFSHSFESLSDIEHENMTIKIINSPTTEINKLLKRYDEKLPTMISEILLRKYKKKWCYQLINSQIDVDRMDYILRDSQHSIFNYSSENIYTIIELSKIVDGNFAFDIKALSFLEIFIINRYHLFSQLYHSETSVLFDYLLKSIFEELQNMPIEERLKLPKIIRIFLDKDYDLDFFLSLNDWNFLEAIVKLKDCTKNKKILKLVGAIENYSKVKIYDLTNAINFDQEKLTAKSKYWFNTSSSKIIYQDDDKEEEVLLFSPSNELKTLSHHSSIFNAIKKNQNNTAERKFLFVL